MASELIDLKQQCLDRLEEIKELASQELSIDEVRLDEEALKTPRLHSRWLSLLCDEALRYKKLQALQKKIFLDRTKYFSGTASDSYYSKHGVFHQKILKTDLGLYLDADDLLNEVKEVVEIQFRIVDFLERTMKEIGSRTFHIKSAIEWRRFESGS